MARWAMPRLSSVTRSSTRTFMPAAPRPSRARFGPRAGPTGRDAPAAAPRRGRRATRAARPRRGARAGGTRRRRENGVAALGTAPLAAGQALQGGQGEGGRLPTQSVDPRRLLLGAEQEPV